MLTKHKLAYWIHEFNNACKKKIKGGEVCENCWPIATSLMVLIGNSIVKEGCKRKGE